MLTSTVLDIIIPTITIAVQPFQAKTVGERLFSPGHFHPTVYLSHLRSARWYFFWKLSLVFRQEEKIELGANLFLPIKSNTSYLMPIATL